MLKISDEENLDCVLSKEKKYFLEMVSRRVCMFYATSKHRMKPSVQKKI